MLSNPNIWQAFQLVYENEGEGEGEGNNGNEGGGSGDGDGAKSYTQEQLNKMMADNRRKLTQQNETLVSELTTLKDQANLTAQDKTELEERIEKLQVQNMSKEEIAKREASKAAKSHQLELGSLTKERDAWQKRYTKARVATELTTAALEAKATVPEQIVQLLGPNTYLSPVLGDDNKPTGDFETLVKFSDVSEEGKAVVLDLTPFATLKRMQELTERFSNLFINPGTGGMGGNSGQSGKGGQKQTVEALKDTNAYMKWRKANPKADPTQFSG